MILDIEHTTTYEYSGLVFLEPQVLRLTPRQHPHQKVISHELEITPGPAGQSLNIDAEGNPFKLCWFENKTTQLTIKNRLQIDSTEYRPYDFLVYPLDRTSLPMSYPEHWLLSLSSSLLNGDGDEGVRDYTAEAAAQTDGQAVTFLSAFVKKVSDDFGYEYREDGAPHSANETLNLGKGSCRDLAVFFMAACREQGFACRFVSGYRWLNDPAETNYMHAWAEVYIPGGGWRGFDPSAGAAVDHEYVTLCAAPEPYLATPIEGSFRGDAEQKMTTELTVRKR